MTVVVAPAAKPPILVLACSLAVVVGLFGEEAVELAHGACPFGLVRVNARLQAAAAMCEGGQMIVTI